MHVHKRGNESVCKRIRRGTEVHLYFLRHVEFIPTSVNQFGCLMKSFLCSEAMSSAWGLHYVQRWSTWYSDLDLRHFPYSLLMRKLVALTTKQKKNPTSTANVTCSTCLALRRTTLIMLELIVKDSCNRAKPIDRDKGTLCLMRRK
jgi:hypothetical protein